MLYEDCTREFFNLGVCFGEVLVLYFEVVICGDGNKESYISDLTVLEVKMGYYFSLSLWTCTTNSVFYLLVSVLGGSIGRKIRPPSMMAFCGILVRGIKANILRANRPSFSSFIDCWILWEVY